MWDEYLKALLALLLFVCFPFATIAVAAGLLRVLDRLSHLHSRPIR